MPLGLWRTEIENVVNFLKGQREVEYDMNFVKNRDESALTSSGNGLELGELDELYEDAKRGCTYR